MKEPFSVTIKWANGKKIVLDSRRYVNFACQVNRDSDSYIDPETGMWTNVITGGTLTITMEEKHPGKKRG